MAATIGEVGIREMATAINLGERSSKADIRGLQQLVNTMGARAMFHQEIIPNGEWQEPDFEGVNKTLSSIDWSPGRKSELQKKAGNYKNIVEGNLSAEHAKIAGAVLGDMSGIVMAIAKEVTKEGEQIDPQKISAQLKDGSFVGTNIGRIVDRMMKDTRFIKRLKSRAAGFDKGHTLEPIEVQYKSLSADVKSREDSFTKHKESFDKMVITYRDWETGVGGRTPADLDNFKKDYDNYKNYLKATSHDNLPTALKRGEFNSKAELTNYQTSLAAYLPAIGHGIDPTTGALTRTRATTAQENAAAALINGALLASNNISAILDNPHFTKDNRALIDRYEKKAKDAENTALTTEESQLNAKKAELDALKVTRKVGLEKYGHEVDIALEAALKGYYNDVLFEDAKRIAALQVEYKAGDKSREAKIKSLLERFMLQSCFKYNKKGETKGIDNKWVKKAAKSIKSHGPEGMARLMMERIIQKKNSFSPTLRAELEELMKEINPDNPARPWEMVSRDYMKTLGNEFTPSILGYAYQQNYWWDRIKFSKPQVEFVAANYDADFWEKILVNKEKYQGIVDNAVGKGVLNLSETENGKLKTTLKKHLGENSVEFTKKLMKVLPYVAGAGVVGAGLYFGVPAAINAAPAVGKAISDAVGAAGSAIGGATSGITPEAVGKAIRGAGETVANTAGNVAGAIGQAVEGVAKGVTNQAVVPPNPAAPPVPVPGGLVP